MKPLRLFLVLAFGLFIVGFGMAGLLLSIGAPDWVVTVVQIAMAWTPTVAFVVIHRRVDPGRSLWRYVRDQFVPRVKAKPLLTSIFIPVIAGIVVWLAYAFISGKAPLALVADLSVGGVLILFFGSLIRGPLGEELGWRGYLLVELNKRFSLLSASLLVGVIWAVWHFPLWFVTDYQGIELLLYVAFFVAGIISFSVIIAYVYMGGSRNLLYAILLHQMLNFTPQLLDMNELVVLGGTTGLYALLAIAIGVKSATSSRAVVATA